jgi:hypothetical protein
MNGRTPAAPTARKNQNGLSSLVNRGREPREVFVDEEVVQKFGVALGHHDKPRHGDGHRSRLQRQNLALKKRKIVE